MRALVLAFALVLAACASQPPVPPPTPLEARGLSVKLDFEFGYCTGTSIETPLEVTVILTAGHCVEDRNITEMEVDGEEATITQTILDGRDHAILVTDLPPRAGARLAPPPRVTERVYFWGNSRFEDLFRRGTVAKVEPEPHSLMPDVPNWVIIDAQAAPGDSGSGIFDQNGKVVGVLSVGVTWSAVLMTGCFPYNFERAAIEGVVVDVAVLSPLA